MRKFNERMEMELKHLGREKLHEELLLRIATVREFPKKGERQLLPLESSLVLGQVYR